MDSSQLISKQYLKVLAQPQVCFSQHCAAPVKQCFTQNCPTFSSFHLPINYGQLPSLTEKKHPHSMILPPAEKLFMTRRNYKQTILLRCLLKCFEFFIWA